MYILIYIHIHIGVFAAMWAKFNNRANAYNTWIIADGPVDAIWIEDLNTVLDDNKVHLCLKIYDIGKEILTINSDFNCELDTPDVYIYCLFKLIGDYLYYSIYI
jgi:hypothetical protein